MQPWKPKLVGGSSVGKRTPSVEPGAANTTVAYPIEQPPPGQRVNDRQLSFAVLMILIAGAFYVAYIIFSPFLTAIFLAFVLAIAFAPLHQWIKRRIRSANAAALLTTTAILLLIVLPSIFVSLRLATEAAGVYSSVSQQWKAGTAWYQSLSGLSEALQRTAERTGVPVQQLKSGVTARVQQFGATLVGIAAWAARGVMQQLVTAFLVFLVLFFLLRDQKEFRRGLAGMLPLHPRRVLELTTTVHESIVANIYGMFAVGLIQGVLIAIGFWMAGLRAPLLWGAVAMVCSFVPLVGPSLVWIPGCVVLAMQNDWTKVILLAIWGGVVVASADYIIRPKIAGGRVNANRLLVLLSFLGGVKAFGVIGIFVGPVVLSLIIALLRIFREEYGSRRYARSLAA